MNYIKISPCDVANGPGVRVVLWVSGCSIGCIGCHNPHTHNQFAGQSFDWSAMNDLLLALNKPYIQGITFSGGHPLEDYNLASIYNIIKTIKTKYPDKDIWLYTGYTLNISHFTTIRNPISRHDFESNLMHDILLLCDVVVDGPYIQELRDISLLYRGSRNQRLIDVKQTLAKGEIQLWSKP